MKAIGINGDVGAGKDTLFDMLPGLKTRYAFGDALKLECAQFITGNSLQDVLAFLIRERCPLETIVTILQETYLVLPTSLSDKVLRYAVRSRSVFAYKWFAQIHAIHHRNWTGHLVMDVTAEMHSRSTKERFRSLLRWWGTEYRREKFSPDYWVDQLAAKLRQNGLSHLPVITDVRFPNEAHFVKNVLGGLVVRIERVGTESNHVHTSDTALDDWPFDLIIPNNDGLEDLRREAVKLWELVK